MTHEKIITREDGTQVKITIILSFISNPGRLGSYHKWANFVQYKVKRGRVWKSDRFELKTTLEEIYKAKLELWCELKPTK